MAQAQISGPPKKDVDTFDTWLIQFWQLVAGPNPTLSHSSLSGLAWASSGHTGTASTLASFDGSGAAAYQSLGSGVATFLATPSSANLRGALTDETGTGAAYFQGGDIGTPSAGVLTNCTGLPVSTGISGLGTNVAAFLATPSSANLAAALTDEQGSGKVVFDTSPTLTTPNIGAATGTSLVATSKIRSSGGTSSDGIGYNAGAGGTVTQITSKSTSVTINKYSGAITMNNAALAGGAKVTFTVSNSLVSADDGVFVWMAQGVGTTKSAYRANVTDVTGTGFDVTVENITAGSLSEAPKVCFAVIKAAST